MNKNMIALSTAGFLLSACVTINIYFPAAATEKAADKIIDEVWQTQKPEQQKPEQQKPEPPKSSEVQNNSKNRPADNNTHKETK